MAYSSRRSTKAIERLRRLETGLRMWSWEDERQSIKGNCLYIKAGKNTRCDIESFATILQLIYVP